MAKKSDKKIVMEYEKVTQGKSELQKAADRVRTAQSNLEFVEKGHSAAKDSYNECKIAFEESARLLEEMTDHLYGARNCLTRELDSIRKVLVSAWDNGCQEKKELYRN